MEARDANSRRTTLRDGLALGVLCGLLYFTGLGVAPLWDDDEARFAFAAREMLRSGDWIVPRDNEGLANKPAAFFWFMATSFRLFGETPFAARTFSALCGVLSVLVTWKTLLALADRRAAFLASLALASSMLFVIEARAATMDAALFLAIACTMRVPVAAWWEKGHYALRRLTVPEAMVAGVFIGAGTLLKGLVALVLPALVASLFVFFAGNRAHSRLDRIKECLTTLRPFVCLAAAMVVALPWHVAVGWQTGGEWPKVFYLDHHFGRVSAVMEGHGGIPLLQVPMVLVGLFPWSVFLPLALWRCGRAAFGPAREPAALLAFVWFLAWIGVFSLSATQLPNYVLPAYPAACLMIANLCIDAVRHPMQTAPAWLYAAAAGLLAGGAMVAVALFSFARFHGMNGWPRESWVMFLPVATAAVFALAVHFGRRGLALHVFSAGAILFSWTICTRVAPSLASADPLPALFEAKKNDSPQQTVWATYRFTAPSVSWLCGTAVKKCRTAGDLAAFLREVPAAAALVNEEALPELVALLGHRPVPVRVVQPLLRGHRVCLLDARSLGPPPEGSALEVP